jgi:DNA-binding beta-propeller fold protein YncE
MRRGEFSNPGEIEKDDKYIYIADESNNRVQVFDKQKVWVKELSLPKTKISKSSFGLNYSIKKVGINLYVLDKKNKKIYNYENLTLKNTVDLKNFIEPYKLYNVDKKLFVYEKVKNEFVDIKTNKKIKMDVPSDVTLIDIKTFGEAPMGVYFAKNSQLYYFSLIAETSRPLKKVLPVGEGYYVKPIDIKRDISKNVYILDEVLNEILVYSAVGKFIKKIGNLPPSSYSFDIDNNGDFIILSNKTNSIYRLSYNGRKINSLENSYNLLAYEPYYYKDKKNHQTLIV